MKHSEIVPKFFVVGVKDFIVSQDLLSFLRQFKVSGLALFNSPHDHPQNIWADPDAAAEGVYEFSRVISPMVPFLSVDQEGGRVRRLRKPFVNLPSAGRIGIAIENGMENAVAELYRLSAQQMGLADISVVFAPVCDIRYPEGNDVIGDRSFGETAELVLKAVKFFCNIFEQEDLRTILKHYPGHGPTHFDSHAQIARLFKTQSEMAALDSRIFLDSIDHASGVMTAHIAYKDFPERIFSLDKEWVLETKNKFGRDKVLISDDLLSMKAVSSLRPWIKCYEAGYDYILTCGTLDEAARAIEETIRHSEQRSIQFEEELTIERRAEKSWTRFAKPHKRLSFAEWKSELLRFEDEAQYYLDQIK